MSVPIPPLEIAGHCSTIYNNTLYLFSTAGFQSLALSDGAEWNILSPGVSVAGPACVSDNNSAFWVIGGTPNSTVTGFLGLQRYTFSTGTWENVTPSVPVTQNRQGHGAAFLPQQNSLLVYAGSQTPGDTGLSSQTFLISSVPPYNVLSYNSVAPPSYFPTLMSWNESHAVMIGGRADNTAVTLFGPSGWSYLGTTLKVPITTPASSKPLLLTGADGSKVLEIFNLGVSPNEVTSDLLFANGQAVPPGTPLQKRQQLTVGNWPAYNATGAPTDIRSSFQVARGSDGLVVISGGGPSDKPIQLFQETTASWVDADSVFGGTQIPLSVVPTTNPATVSSMPSSTLSSSPFASSSSASDAALAEAKAKTMRVLGGAIGGILGFAALLIILLLLLRWRSEKIKKREVALEEAEKDGRLSFADKGNADFMDSPDDDHIPPSYNEPNNTNSFIGSMSSFQIFGGKAASGQNGNHRRNQQSDSSQIGLVTNSRPIAGRQLSDLELSRVNNDKFSPPSPPKTAQSSRTITKAPATPYDTTNGIHYTDRSTAGWSAYFVDSGHATNFADGQSQESKTKAESKAKPQSDQFGLEIPSAHSSILSTSTYTLEYDSLKHESTIVPPPKARDSLATANFSKPRSRPTSKSVSGATGMSHADYLLAPQHRRAMSTFSDSEHNAHWSVLSEDRASDTSSIMTTFAAPPKSGTGISLHNNTSLNINNNVPPISIHGPGQNSNTFGAENDSYTTNRNLSNPSKMSSSTISFNTQTSPSPRDFPMPNTHMVNYGGIISHKPQASGSYFPPIEGNPPTGALPSYPRKNGASNVRGDVIITRNRSNTVKSGIVNGGVGKLAISPGVEQLRAETRNESSLSSSIASPGDVDEDEAGVLVQGPIVRKVAGNENMSWLDTQSAGYVGTPGKAL